MAAVQALGTDGGSLASKLVQIAAGAQLKTLLDGNGASDWEFATSGGWQNWTPTLSGWSSNPANGVYRYKQIGKLVHLAIRQPTDGTSNATTKTISLPVTAATITNMVWDGTCRVVDIGVSSTTFGLIEVASAGTTASLFTNANGAAWTNTGNARVPSASVIYEAA